MFLFVSSVVLVSPNNVIEFFFGNQLMFGRCLSLLRVQDDSKNKRRASSMERDIYDFKKALLNVFDMT